MKKSIVKQQCHFKTLAILFFLTFGVGQIWGARISNGQVFYFKSNSNWKTSSPRYAAAFQNSDKSYTYWYSCIAVPGESDTYYAVSNGDYDWLLFCRMKPDDATNSWSNPPCWNTTSALDVNSNYNKFDKSGSDWSSDVSWNKYSPPMSSVTLSNTSTVYGGDGSEGNPFQIKISTTLSVSASATSAVEADGRQTKQYNFYRKTGSGSRTSVQAYSTTNTYSFTASSTAGTTYAIDVVARNKYTPESSTYGATATSSKIYFITVDPIYAILGEFNSWTHDAATWDLSDQGSNNWDATFSLAANTTYEFKVVYNSIYYGKGTSSYTTVTRASNSVNTLATGEGIKNLKITTDFAGNYTFRFNSSTKNLTVTYPTAYTITYGVGNINGSNAAISTSPSFTSGDYVLKSSSVTFVKGSTKAGYTWKGWYPNANGSGVAWSTSNSNWTSAANSRTGNISVYACYNYATYSVDLDQTSAAEEGNVYQVTATYNTAMPTISGSGALPTAEDGYAFMGYYDEPEGEGTKYYNSDGTSAHIWNKTSEGIVLYAYFKKADITDITLNQEAFVPVDAGAAATYVQANPVISPTPVEPTIVCWELLYSNNNPVPDKDPIADTGGGSYPRRVKFSINGLAAGTYKIKATLRTGSSCPDGGTILSVYTQNFRIASSHTLDIQYICDDEILSTGSVEVPALGTQSITAPTHTTDVNSPFFGYSFHHWELPDGVTCTSGNTGNGNTKGDLTISVSATYGGTIKVHYTHRGMIFYKKPSDWSSFANVYYYKISGTDKWHESEEDYKYRGLYTTSVSAYQMTRIGTSSIYYYDYEGTATTADDPGEYVAFTNESKGNQSPLYYCSASWPSKYTKGYNAGTPMFVAANYISEAYNSVNYYNRGHWTKYHRDWTADDYPGYTLKIYNQKEAGRIELKSVHFTATSADLPFKAVVELEAAQTYGFKFVRDNNIYYKNDNDNTMDYTHRSNWIFEYDGADGTACGITTTATGNYTFTLTLDQTDGKLRISVDYPIANNDYRLIYKDNNHTKWHPSATIARQNNHKDTVSFFVRKDQSPIVKIQKATVNGSTGAVTWADYNEGANLLETIPSVISSQTDTMVFNFNMQTNGSGAMTLESINPYRGDFYIRVDAANNKWDSYQAADHLMTYTEFSESDANISGPKYSHYFCAWCPRGRNVKFTVANDYSPCISDTLIQDATFNNIDVNGNLLNAGGDETSDRYSANIRFMWNRKTNYIGRAYVASSTNTTKRFLVLVCKDAYMHDADNNAISATANLEANAVLLQDDQNWIYETIVKVRPTARVRLYASYAQASPSANGAQYFRGSYNASFTDANTIQLLGGSGSQYYLMRVIYDFKTNRLITAWLPDGTDIEGNPLNIDADVMVIRDHQQAAEAITFHSSSDKLGQVKTVYGTMRFNRWTLNNRARGLGGEEDFVKEHCNTTEAISTYHPLLDEGDQLSSFERNTYFISFPFDVQLNEVFGFGNYGEHWIISKYNGLRRAQVGYFMDNCINGDFDCTNWDFIWDRSGVTLNAYEGYLLSLDLDKMKYDDTTKFWLKQIQQVELYFPSKLPMSTITTTNVEIPALGTEYQCTKNYNFDGDNPEGDRRVKDSYWRCIGVPSYATYGTVLKDGDGNNISWQKNYSWDVNPNNLPFLYEWNTTDNTLTPQVTSTYSFKPLHSYLVQCKSKIKWTAVSATPASIVRRQRAETQHDYTWRLNLAGDNNDESDTYIRMTDDEEVTDGFDFGPDMIKKFRDGYIVDANGDPIWDSSIDDYKQGILHSDIYSMLGYEYLAANSMPFNTTSTTVVPVGIRLKKAGLYTISLPDGAHGVGITLVDNTTGGRTNLSAGLEYQFDAEAGQNDNRFLLEIAPIKQVPTDIDVINGENGKDGARKVLIDGQLYIIRDGKVYDARGNKVE